jgi:copper oxidase (laccase) domain-containing protein
MDLWQLTRDQLTEAGLFPKNIFALDLCTHSMEEWFFSYRRNNTCGRQASIIWMEK